MSVKTFLAGMSVGMGAAALLAPKRGADLRRDIASSTTDYARSAREKIGSVFGDGSKETGNGSASAQAGASDSGRGDSGQGRATELAGGSNQQGSAAGGSFVERVNSARREELLAVYGIGPVIADQIIQNRPYRSENDLIERNVVPESAFDHLKRQLSTKRTA
jgi:gas vesicle protein